MLLAPSTCRNALSVAMIPMYSRPAAWKVSFETLENAAPSMEPAFWTIVSRAVAMTLVEEIPPNVVLEVVETEPPVRVVDPATDCGSETSRFIAWTMKTSWFSGSRAKVISCCVKVFAADSETEAEITKVDDVFLKPMEEPYRSGVKSKPVNSQNQSWNLSFEPKATTGTPDPVRLTPYN